MTGTPPTAGGWARFDDLRTGTAIRCPAPDRILVAEHSADVVGVLAEVERATDAGRWAFGYVAYEAAIAPEPRLVAHRAPPMDVGRIRERIAAGDTRRAAGTGVAASRPGPRAGHRGAQSPARIASRGVGGPAADRAGR